MSDISFKFDSDKGYADIQTADGDFVLGDPLETAIGLSLFTDRRATNQEIREFQTGIIERQSRRGYWANTYRDFTQGSGLWLLSRSKRQEITRSRAEAYALECLQWLKQDGVAKSVDAFVSLSGQSGLDIQIRITKPAGEELNYKYQFVWS
jgi:phage gp46-like protein